MSSDNNFVVSNEFKSIDDVDLEIEKITQTIDTRSALAFAEAAALQHGKNPEHIIHLKNVGKTAEALASAYYVDYDTLHRRYIEKVCCISGYMHEVLLMGKTFEDVVRISDVSVARIISAVTPDVRLPIPERIVLYTNRVGLADAPSQIVKMADLIQEAIEYKNTAFEKFSDSHKQWLAEARTLAKSLHKLVDSPLTGQLRELNSHLREVENRFRIFSEEITSWRKKKPRK